MGTSLKECIYDLSRTLYELDAISKEKFEKTEAYYMSSDNLPYESAGFDEFTPENLLTD